MKRAGQERCLFSHPAVLALVSILFVVFFASFLAFGGGVSLELTDKQLFILGCCALGLFLVLLLVSRASRLSAWQNSREHAREIAADLAEESVRELEREKTRRTEAEQKAHRILESESFLVKASLGLTSRETTTDVVQHLADEALSLFQVRWAIVGAFPANSRELKIMGAARHASIKEGCTIKQPISGKGLFRSLWMKRF